MQLILHVISVKVWFQSYTDAYHILVSYQNIYVMSPATRSALFMSVCLVFCITSTSSVGYLISLEMCCPAWSTAIV